VKSFTSYLLAALIVIVLTMQARLLYIFPAPDSARWWGDETGQMLELRAELQDGHARIPTALGSSLEQSNGLVRSNSWFAAFVYGIPLLLFRSVADVVAIGRTVTFTLSLLLCAIIFVIMRRLKIDESLALLAILLLASTRSFFYASHAARLDIAVAISVLLFVSYLAICYQKYVTGTWRPTSAWCFLYGVIAIFFATLSIHLLTLLGLLSLFVLVQFSIYRNVRLLGASVAGVLCVVVVLTSVYWLSDAPMTLFSTSIRPNQFQSVASGLPILRPFSRSVQWANILERATGLWSEARLSLLISVVVLIFSAFKKQRAVDPERIFWIRATLVIFIAWLFFQSPALYYYMHVLPLFLMCLAVMLSNRTQLRDTILIGLGVGVAFAGIRDTTLAAPLAKAIAHDNHAAIDSMLRLVGQKDRPIVSAQNPAISQVEHSERVRLMTPHFLDFADRNESSLQTMKRVGVRYMMLYTPGDHKIYSSDYAALRPLADSFAIVRSRIPGVLLDANRDYFCTPSLELPKDTLIFYELAR
jgi:hypothetical protein